MDIRSVFVSIFATLAVSAGAGTLYVDVATGEGSAEVGAALGPAGVLLIVR